jgi:endonuclease YncB( thermonuclease family)
LALRYDSCPYFSWPTRIVSITDGDTITVLHEDQQTKALKAALVICRNMTVEQPGVRFIFAIGVLLKTDAYKNL